MRAMNEINDAHCIAVSAVVTFLESESAPDDGRYVFAYTMTIRNVGAVPARLLSRHWIITDAHGRVQEVKGEGVVGEQPHLQPGDSFRYTSAALIETPVGTMHGSYQMQADDGVAFEAEIPAFTLSMPKVLH